MKICDLLKDIITPHAIINATAEILGLSSDSRDVKEGYLFVCLSKNAMEFIPQAISNGASLVIAPDLFVGSDVILHRNPKDIYHKIASRFYNNRQPKFVAAVTGTNGKTSVAHFTQQLWHLLRQRAANIGTTGIYVGERQIVKNKLTTPDAAHLHNYLAMLCDYNVDYLCMEASSHGIEQHRINSIVISAAAFTNISQDHFDYHQNLDNYFAAKKRLFTERLQPQSTVIINYDAQEAEELITATHHHRIITYGSHEKCDLQLLEQFPSPTGQLLKIKVGNKIHEKFFPVLGQFQASNLLCAIGIIMSSGVKFDNLPIEMLKAPCGRMEQVAPGIIIDYAHTPDALEKSLLALRWHSDKKIVVVFGCGGDRDRGKRPLMGQVASKCADVVVVTDDNPRREDPSQIRREIFFGCDHDKVTQIADRRQAISCAITIAKQNDMVVLIAGKGHETEQIIGGQSFAFSDAAVVRECVDQ